MRCTEGEMDALRKYVVHSITFRAILGGKSIIINVLLVVVI